MYNSLDFNDFFSYFLPAFRAYTLKIIVIFHFLPSLLKLVYYLQVSKLHYKKFFILQKTQLIETTSIVKFTINIIFLLLLANFTTFLKLFKKTIL